MVQYRGDSIIISRNGKAAAAIVSMEVYETWKDERKAFFNLIRNMQNENGLSAEDAEKVTADAIEQIRKHNPEI
jgi:PHD/YefM family antitoxin component YafN of YafNO toxin-antitoxin module